MTTPINTARLDKLLALAARPGSAGEARAACVAIGKLILATGVRSSSELVAALGGDDHCQAIERGLRTTFADLAAKARAAGF